MPESTSLPLDVAQVAHLANLARIALTPEETEKLTGELGVIMHDGRFQIVTRRLNRDGLAGSERLRRTIAQ